MISADHPLHFIAPALSKKGGTLHLSKYVYAPDSLFDQREYLKVESHQLSAEWLSKLITSLRPNEEVAFHSTFVARDRTWHVPMIDFSPEQAAVSAAMDRLRMYLPRPVFQSMAFFRSGRSLHAYSTTLLSPKEWLNFNGRLLLTNIRGGLELVDARWIGHRLIGGFSALRWSCNTMQYLEMPSRIRLF